MPALLVIVLLLALAPAASAQGCDAPPGTSAVDEYCETVPAATGDRGGKPAPPARPVPQRTLRDLEQAGPEAEALLRQLDPDGKARARDRQREEPALPVAASPAVSEPSSNPLDAVRSVVEDGPIAGSALIWLLLAATLAMTGAWWLRFRRDRT